MGSAMGKADEAATGALSDLVLYIFSPIPALSAYLDQHPAQLIGGTWGTETFRFITAVMASIDLSEKPPSLLQDFIPVPHLTNLYTAYFHYLNDFGWAGVIVIPSLLGFLHGGLFQWATANRDDDFAFFILSVSYLPLVQTMFQETHFTSMSSWLSFIFIGLLMTRHHAKAPLTQPEIQPLWQHL